MRALENEVPTADDLRRVFDAATRATVGIEEEVMLLHPGSLDLAPRAADVLDRVAGDASVKGELPASQLELLTPPRRTVGEASADLHAARRRLATAASGIGELAASGVHPFAAAEGELSAEDRYEHTRREYGRIARRQLVSGLHVHVAIGPADRALAVYNAMRSHLPDLAALAANSPFHGGEDTGLASVRPKLAEALPRQGVPPVLDSLEEMAGALRWGMRAGVLATPRQWWWEARLHPVLGTLEIRVCDAQPTVAQTAAVAAVVHALCVWLAERQDAGDLPPAAPTWRIEENRWSACRHGVRGAMADLRTGALQPTSERLEGLLGDLEPVARRLGCHAELASAKGLIECPAPQRYREIAEERGLRGLLAWLAQRFLAPLAG